MEYKLEVIMVISVRKTVTPLKQPSLSIDQCRLLVGYVSTLYVFLFAIHHDGNYQQ